MAKMAAHRADQVVTLVHSKSDGSLISQFDYRYDLAGNRTGVLEADGARVTWTYDTADQLTNEQRSGANAYYITHRYDPVGNRLVKTDSSGRSTFTYDAANQILTETEPSQNFTFKYDDAGNLAARVVLTIRNTFVWDGENRLTLSRSNFFGQARVTCSYDGDGRRIKQQINASTTTKYHWDEEQMLLETDGSNALKAAYTLEPAGYGNLISQRRSGATTFYLADVLGSTDRLLNASQTTLNRYIYSAFGTDVSTTGSTTNLYRWLGGLGYYRDGAILPADYYVRARYYGITIARWMSEDPIRFGATEWNLYRYVKNRAIVAVDPSGLQECSPTLRAWGMCPPESPVLPTPRPPFTPPTRTPVEPFDPSKDYCGSTGTESVPDAGVWPAQIFRFGHCCYDHDVCYGTCGRTRSDCDDLLLSCMLNQCSNYSAQTMPIPRLLCRAQAIIYHAALAFVGDYAFGAAQRNNNCQPPVLMLPCHMRLE